MASCSWLHSAFGGTLLGCANHVSNSPCTTNGKADPGSQRGAWRAAQAADSSSDSCPYHAGFDMLITDYFTLNLHAVLVALQALCVGRVPSPRMD